MKNIVALVLCQAASGLFAPLAFAEPMTFRFASAGGNCAGCEWIAAEGEITADTPAEFRDYVAQNEPPYDLTLNSSGGDLMAGLQLGKLIREFGATTNIGRTIPMAEEGLEHFQQNERGICTAACAFAFMGGVDRYAGADNLIGVQRFYSADGGQIESAAGEALAGKVLLYLIGMGIDPRVAAVASSTEPGQIHWFTHSDLVTYGLDNTSF